MNRKPRPPEDTVPTKLEVTLEAHIVQDLQTMASNTKRTVDELVRTSLQMYIATHNDYLKRNRVP